MADVDWGALRAEAVAMMKRSYSPYSEFPVGCAALVDDGRVVSGCNVENSSYGLTLCAECSMVSQLIGTGGGRLVAFTCVNGDEDVTMPCGRCRQLLAEHGGPEMLIETLEGVMSFIDVLPQQHGFGIPKDRLRRSTTR